MASRLTSATTLLLTLAALIRCEDESCETPQSWSDAAGAVRADFAHAWSGYAHEAWGRDELAPLSNGSNNRWGGLAVTMLDSLDSLLLMQHTE
eukprot:7264973-Prymnesium_polylepis.1